MHGDAQELPFDDQVFELVVMGFGMNHLPEPEIAAKEAWRVLKPGVAFAFSVWATPAKSEGIRIVLTAIERHGVSDVKLAAAPPYFRFADKSALSLAEAKVCSDLRRKRTAAKHRQPSLPVFRCATDFTREHQVAFSSRRMVLLGMTAIPQIHNQEPHKNSARSVRNVASFPRLLSVALLLQFL